MKLYYPLSYVLHAWADYHRHGQWPRPGGFDAQDVALIADFQTVTRRYNWHVRRLLDEDKGSERDLDVDEYIGAIAGVSQTDWRDVLGE